MDHRAGSPVIYAREHGWSVRCARGSRAEKRFCGRKKTHNANPGRSARVPPAARHGEAQPGEKTKRCRAAQQCAVPRPIPSPRPGWRDPFPLHCTCLALADSRHTGPRTTRVLRTPSTPHHVTTSLPMPLGPARPGAPAGSVPSSPAVHPAHRKENLTEVPKTGPTVVPLHHEALPVGPPVTASQWTHTSSKVSRLRAGSKLHTVRCAATSWRPRLF